MSEEIAQQFLLNHQEIDALNLIRTARCSGLHHLGAFFGKFLEEQFPHSVDIKDEYALNNYFLGNYDEAYEIYRRLLKFPNLTEQAAKAASFNAHFSINHIADKHIQYNPKKVEQITKLNRKKKLFPLITVTITTCKRLDLFLPTINSFINCCQDIDLVDEWICVDDNSSDEDRKKMCELYPFIVFYMKDKSAKGHPQSMNIIRQLVKTPYMFHMEDDWKFFAKRHYFTDCLSVLGENPKIGQCLINKNYAETEADVAILGGEYHQSKSGLRYYIHEQITTEQEREAWTKKHGNGTHCNYWPHFSFRPSLLRTKILHELGEFDQTISHFEMDYSRKYIAKGYISAFLEGIYCLHTGRLTSQMNDPTKLNAYILNDEAQFVGKEEKLSNVDKPISTYEPTVTLKDFNLKLKTFVVNLDRRPDRWESFQKKATPLLTFLNYERFPAIDGNKLQTNAQLQRIFDNNDYNMRKGMVGCAMSHIKLYTDLINSEDDAYLLLEDDLDFTPEFDKKLLHLYNQVKIFPWDMLYLGHHLRKDQRNPEAYDKEKLPHIEKWNAHTALTRSLGGTGGYLISKAGAKKLLDFIDRTGMTNGIDTVQQKAADIMHIFYAHPHLFYSECFMGDNHPDTDIQYDYESLTLSLEDRITNEISYHGEMTNLSTFTLALAFVTQDQTTKAYYQGSTEEVAELQEKCIHPCYTLETTVLIIVPGGDSERYFHRTKKGNKYDVSDALIYN